MRRAKQMTLGLKLDRRHENPGGDRTRMEQDLISELRRRGFRITTARRAVLSSLIGSEGHLTAEQVAHAVHETNPDVDTSTVYRTLGLFEDLGIVEHAHLGHGPAVYHLGRTHQHLVCEECGAVVDVPVAALDALARELRDQYGFQIRPGHFALMGNCSRHATDPTTGGTALDDREHDHDAPHSHEHLHDQSVHSHAHRQHDHDHVEHEHEHEHEGSADVHVHPHVHEAGLEGDHGHDHD